MGSKVLGAAIVGGAAALATTECRGPTPNESQGESITFRPDFRAYYTVSEGGRAQLHRFEAPPN